MALEEEYTYGCIGNVLAISIRNQTSKKDAKNPDMFEELQAKIPVSDISTNYTYQNIYCATCNAVLNENIVYWGASIECKNRKLFPSSTGTVLEEVNAIRNCNIVYKFTPNGMLMLNCTPKINECNVTGLWKQYDPLVEAACHAYTAIYDSKYKNVFCFLCNEASPAAMPSQCVHIDPGDISVPFCALLKFSWTSEANRAQDPVTPVENHCTQTQVYDPLNVSVHVI